MLRVLLLTTVLCCFMLISNGQEIVNITVRPPMLLPENGTQNKVSVSFDHINVPDGIICRVNCEGRNEMEEGPHPDGNKWSCIYYVLEDVRAAKHCLMNLTSSQELEMEREITFYIGESVSVDRNPLFMEAGDDAIVTVIDGKYPDPVICDFVKQDGSQDGFYKQTDCEMSIQEIGFADAGLYNFTICLPGSSEDGCVKGQKEIIVWQCSYDKMSNSVMVNITSADDGIDIRCVNGCSYVAESVITENDGIRSFVWSNVTTIPYIVGAYKGMVFLNSSCMNTVKGHISDPQSETSKSVIVWIIVSTVVVAMIIVVLGLLKWKRMGPCFNRGSKAGNESGMKLEEQSPLNEKNGHAG